MSLFLIISISTVKIALKSPLLVFGREYDGNEGNISKCLLISIQTMQIILFPLVPAMILYAAHLEEEVQAKLLQEVYEMLKCNRSTKKLMEKLDKSKTYLKKLKTHLLSIKLNEVVETNVQLVLQSVMIALFASSTSTTSAMVTVFGSDSPVQWISTKVLIALSIVLSCKTSVTTRIKWKQEKFGGYLPLKPKAIIAMRTLLTTGACITNVFV